MASKVDLHTHTLASDGALSPADLVARAAAHGVNILAVTDHDTCSGLPEAAEAAENLSVTLINGIELSTVWKGIGIHIVGLDVDPLHGSMLAATKYQTRSRNQRAIEIAEKLEKRHMPGVHQNAADIAGTAQIGRPHFAKAMVAMGYVSSEQEAFERYLGAGKVGDVKCHWPSLEQVINWIEKSGGVPVLAHPGKYGMTWTKLRTFLDEFISLGGQAMEVSYGAENPDRLFELCKLAQRYKLMASVGSDFHSPRYSWTEVGKYPPVRGTHDPVWARWT
ncbi:PHP domain-containing protein [Motiliproteus sp. MSK22-1]|uniref:PHP domain-containing protein n=1 Tax=Motiliproteus sp. MSK22-1 TaxID=1897630 RepID=UPI000978CFD7|nr:PHP domain-containing protein [Motiliproteus sp. MSK22-1]OMH31851.1 hypothetical protein BGP75_17230 [Motiliproteus sp. MSK22-1]